MSTDPNFLGRIIEGALLASGEALSVDRLLGLFEEHERPDKQEVHSALQRLQSDCDGRGYALEEVASGWRFQVATDLAQWVNRLWDEKPQKYSRALLETLALIAYRQPLTRSDIEEVRGVAVSSHIIRTLAEREWIKVVGHRDVPGRPSLFATTRQFLDYFGLKSLEELPSLSELKDFDGLNRNLQLAGYDETLEQDQIADAQEPDAESSVGEDAPVIAGASLERVGTGQQSLNDEWAYSADDEGPSQTTNEGVAQQSTVGVEPPGSDDEDEDAPTRASLFADGEAERGADADPTYAQPDRFGTEPNSDTQSTEDDENSSDL